MFCTMKWMFFTGTMTDSTGALHSGLWKMFPRWCYTACSHLHHRGHCPTPVWYLLGHSFCSAAQVLHDHKSRGLNQCANIFCVILWNSAATWQQDLSILKQRSSPWLKWLICHLTRAPEVSWLDQRHPQVLSWALHTHLFGLLLYLSMKHSLLISSTSPF